MRHRYASRLTVLPAGAKSAPVRRMVTGKARWVLAGLMAVVVCSFVAPASAKEPVDPDEVDPRAGTPREAAPNERLGSIALHGGLGLVAPAGSVTTSVAAADFSSTGPSFSGALEVGISRYLGLEFSGTMGLLDSTTRCSTCSTDSLQLGLGLTYHLTQMLAVDPWIQYGLGYRRTSVSAQVLPTGALEHLAVGDYHGLDVAQLALGVSFAPWQSLAIGPYVEADFGTYVGRPTGARSGNVYAFAEFGLRVTLTPSVWWASPAAASPAAASPAAASPAAAAHAAAGWGPGPQ